MLIQHRQLVLRNLPKVSAPGQESNIDDIFDEQNVTSKFLIIYDHPKITDKLTVKFSL